MLYTSHSFLNPINYLAHRKCCPLIARNSTLTSDLNTATLSLSAMAGNCSKSEGFKYVTKYSYIHVCVLKIYDSGPSKEEAQCYTYYDIINL